MKLVDRTVPFLLFIIISFSIFSYNCKREKVVSIRSMLIGMTDRDNMTRFPEPFYKLKQFSSHDRRSDTGGIMNWFANSDFTHFIGVDSASGRKEYILFDADGPGAIVRWWMTFAGEGSSDGIVRVYIDNSVTPVIEGNVLRVLSGQLLADEPLSSSVSPDSEMHQRGHNLYLPIPYRSHCRITYECDAVVITPETRRPSIYYNICFRDYEKGTKVISLTTDELQNAAALIDRANELLMYPQPIPTGKQKTYTYSGDIAPGDSSVIILHGRKSAISRLKLTISPDNRGQALHSLLLKIDFDGYETVNTPAGYFFGTAYRNTDSDTWMSRVSGGTNMESFWIMPFRERCTVKMINYGSQIFSTDLEVETSDYSWDRRSMYFGSAWHEYHQIETAGSELTGGTGLHTDINFADIEGRGVYAGDAVTVFNTVDAWWGEGDEKIYVDGESFPSSFGTGTEDYYGYAWCRPEIFSHPFIAQPDGSGNFHPGTTINMRYRSLDAIPFKSEIRSDIELWHWLPAVINYSLTTYWYIIPPYRINIEPDPATLKRPVPPDPAYTPPV